MTITVRLEPEEVIAILGKHVLKKLGLINTYKAMEVDMIGGSGAPENFEAEITLEEGV